MSVEPLVQWVTVRSPASVYAAGVPEDLECTATMTLSDQESAAVIVGPLPRSWVTWAWVNVVSSGLAVPELTDLRVIAQWPGEPPSMLAVDRLALLPHTPATVERGGHDLWSLEARILGVDQVAFVAEYADWCGGIRDWTRLSR